jgi:hypothetical protein
MASARTPAALMPILAQLKSIPPKLRPLGPPLGAGRDGVVYATKTPGIVLKITRDRAEAKAALALRLLDLPAPGVVKVRKVAAFLPAGASSPDFYGIWRQQIKPAHSTNTHVVRLIEQLQQALADLAEEREQGRTGSRAAYDVVDDLYRFNARLVGEVGDTLLKLAEHGIILRDSHPGNYGLLDGKPVVFDVGRAWLSPYWKEFPLDIIQLPA